MDGSIQVLSHFSCCSGLVVTCILSTEYACIVMADDAAIKQSLQCS